MDELLKNLTSLSWWIGVVIVGFLVNISSSYFKPWFDKISSRYSEKKKLESEERQRVFEDTVQYLIENPFELLEIRLTVIYYNLRMILFIAAGIFFSLLLFSSLGSFGKFLGTIVGLSFFAIVLRYISRDRNLRKLINGVANKRNRASPLKIERDY